MLEATIVNTAELQYRPFWHIFGWHSPRLPMFLIPRLPNAYHTAPRWKGLESTIQNDIKHVTDWYYEIYWPTHPS